VEKDPIGLGRDGKLVYLRDIWPTAEENERGPGSCADTKLYSRNYGGDLSHENPEWVEIAARRAWLPVGSEEHVHPGAALLRELHIASRSADRLRAARALAIFGDSVTTDHISPAGAIKPNSPAGKYLIALGVKPEDFNSYGARRGNTKYGPRHLRERAHQEPHGARREGGVTVVDGKRCPSTTRRWSTRSAARP